MQAKKKPHTPDAARNGHSVTFRSAIGRNALSAADQYGRHSTSRPFAAIIWQFLVGSLVLPPLPFFAAPLKRLNACCKFDQPADPLGRDMIGRQAGLVVNRLLCANTRVARGDPGNLARAQESNDTRPGSYQVSLLYEFYAHHVLFYLTVAMSLAQRKSTPREKLRQPLK